MSPFAIPSAKTSRVGTRNSPGPFEERLCSKGAIFERDEVLKTKKDDNNFSYFLHLLSLDSIY